MTPRSLLLWVLCLASLAACATRPAMSPVAKEDALKPSTDGVLAHIHGKLDADLAVDESAMLMLPGATEALRWRITLIDAAVSEINAQYFVWHDDAAGSLLMEHLLKAADRGVKVRLLVDDFHLVTAAGPGGNDRVFAALDLHPNLELRLFNPGKYRGGVAGAIGSMASDSQRFNRRMHNKVLEVDGHFAIIGGRNIGNEYFGLAPDYNFVDLDTVLTGEVIEEISGAFDRYWNSEFAYPAGQLVAVEQDDYESLRQDNTEYVAAQASLLESFLDNEGSDQLASFGAGFSRVVADFYADRPSTERNESIRLYETISAAISPPEEEILQATPYLIPARDFLALTQADGEAGVRNQLLTNSLATNNQPAVHAHYEQYRGKLMDRGAQLFEMHHQPGKELRELTDSPPVSARFLALHMKASVIDRRECMIGTMNSDPRSLDINTEDVLHIRSESFCGQLAEHLDELMSLDNAWRVDRSAAGRFQWTSYEGTVERQPVRKASQRFSDWLYRVLPEKQL